MKTVKNISALFCLVVIIASAGCNSYLVEYTSHKGQKKYSLNNDKISVDEKEAWVTATKSNSVNSYKIYVRDFPNGKYTEEAKDILQNANARQKDLLAIYPNDPYDQNLKKLFTSDPLFVDITLMLADYQNGNLLSKARFNLVNKKDESDKFLKVTSEEGMVVFNLKRGDCYEVLIQKRGFRRVKQDLCIKDLNEYIFNLKSVEIQDLKGKPTLRSDGKYYDASGELAYGRFDGVTYKYGEIIIKKNIEAKSTKREKILWNQIQRATDKRKKIQNLEKYISRYPKGAHIDEATAMLQQMEEANTTGGNVQSDNREPALWASINSTSDEDQLLILLNLYLLEYPDGDHIAEVTAMLDILEKESETDDPTTSPTEINPSTVAPRDTSIAVVDSSQNITTKVISEECATDAHTQGARAYKELPSVMKQDTSYNLEIIINDLGNLASIEDDINEDNDTTSAKIDSTKLVTGGSQTVGDYQVDMIRIGSWMKVTLDEPEGQNAFLISNSLKTNESDNLEQKIDCDLNAKWKWRISPKKPGKHTLLLNFYLSKDDGATYQLLKDIEKIIEVKVLQPWYSQLWAQLTMGGLALLSLLFIFWRRRKKRKEDYVFGANLGLAGGVEDVATPPAKPKSVFIAYAKEDEEWTKQIYNQMKVLQKGGFANIWYDQLMEAGSEYKEEIFKHLEESDIIILNISSDFLASDFCDELMQKAIDRQSKGEGVILMPIIVRPCLWATTPLAGLDVFPQNKKPLSDDEWKNVDNAIVNVMNEMEGNLLN